MKIGKIFNFITCVILIIVIIKIFGFYKLNTMNDFYKAEEKLEVSTFRRDSEVKYSEMYSYKIESNEYNDAMLAKTIDVEKNTAYKVSCMVKTENVVPEKNPSDSGVFICVADTVEKSKSIVGTNDWQLLEFTFNSKNRTSLDIGFRLGGNEENCIGTVWFSDFKLEKTQTSRDNNWNFACFVIQNTDVTIAKNGKNEKIKLQMTQTDISNTKSNMSRFKKSCEELSKNNMKVKYDIIHINDTLTTVSYDEENGYFVGPKNVKKFIDPYLEKKEYDHIFVVFKLEDELINDESDWLGLGGMEYNGVGFSDIKVPVSISDKSYTYNPIYNTFPEEVFLHEFLHTLERNNVEYGYDNIELHAFNKYGYKQENIEGLKKWYKDYMQSNIIFNNKKIGLSKELYSLTPPNLSDFTYSIEVEDTFVEPKGVLGEIKSMFSRIKSNFKNEKTEKEEYSESFGF